MFSIRLLEAIRQAELEGVLCHMDPGARVLEIGGGTGHQAKHMAERGINVVSMDVGASNYRDQRVFPVQEYDGRTFPFPDGHFDLIYSSNTLEHVEDLTAFHKECSRVLKQGGLCLHVLPTAVWRFWTTAAHYLRPLEWLFSPSVQTLEGGAPMPQPGEARRTLSGKTREFLRVRRHGERGNAITELWTFRAKWWRNHFHQHGFTVVAVQPIGLFYTGYLLFGDQLSIKLRRKLAAGLGSSTVLFKVQVEPLKQTLAG